MNSPARKKIPRANDEPEAVIQVRNVSKAFKDVQAVNDISLEFRRGEYTALLGPNGAGKTTLVEMIEGIQFPDSGEILIEGMTWQNNEAELRNKLGVALQETRFLEKLRVREIAFLFASLYGESRERALETLEQVNMTSKANAFATELSGGQKQKLVLAVALINNPSILLLDEPTTGLDPAARREVWDILLELKSRGAALVLTTHYMEEAERLCDRILIMDRGRLLTGGTLEELHRNQGGGEIIEFALNRKRAPAGIKKLPGVKSFDWDDERGRGRIACGEIAETLPRLLALLEQKKIKVGELQCRRMTLDDLFIAMTGRRLEE